MLQSRFYFLQNLENRYMRSLCFIWQYWHVDLYIYMHNFSLIHITELATVTLHFVTKSAFLERLIFRPMAVCRKKIIRKRLSWKYSFGCAEFWYFLPSLWLILWFQWVLFTCVPPVPHRKARHSLDHWHSYLDHWYSYGRRRIRRT